MKITALNPLIATGNPENIVELYESLGFRRKQEELTEEGIPAIHLENEYGLYLDVVKDNLVQNRTVIRLNVDDLEEATRILLAQGFRKSERFGEIIENAASRYQLLVSPSGEMIGLIQLKEKKAVTVRDENNQLKRLIKALMYGYTTVGEINYETGEIEFFQYSEQVLRDSDLTDIKMSGRKIIQTFFESGVCDEDREEVKSLFTESSLLEHLKEGESIKKLYRTKKGIYGEIKAVRTGAYSVLFGFTNKDGEITMLKDFLYTDSLTKVYNRRYYDNHLSAESCYALAMSDIDHFKNFNDTYGHQCGDEVLTAAAAVLQAGVRDTDTVVRYGGDEFLISFGKITAEELQERMENLRQGAEKIRIDGYPDLQVTMSFGVVCGYGKVGVMMKQADDILYESKEERNKVIITSLSDMGEENPAE